MRKLFVFFLFILLIFIIGGCSDTSLDVADKIAPPENKSIPIYGEWKIEKCFTKSANTSRSSTVNSWIGKKAVFTDKTAIIGDQLWEDINYKIKKVNTEEYFLYKYKNPVEQLGITDKEILVVTVSSGDKFLYEFVKINENQIMAFLEDNFYSMEKVSDKISSVSTVDGEVLQENKLENARKEDKMLRSGILLGIRTTVKGKNEEAPDNFNEYSYKTLWISSANRELHPVLEANDIFLPRKSGFWKVEVKKADETKRTEDIFLAYSISDVNSAYQFIDSLNPSFWNNREGILRKKILYVGNDYISVECTGKGKIKNSSQSWQENMLQTLPVDKISSSRSVKISDIAGENGTLAMTNAIENMIKTSNSKGLKDINPAHQDESFALFRKTGHWYIKGRVNFQQEGDPVSFMDFNINLIPPTELVAYDVLHLQWTYVKDKIPQAVDAYTSPNEDIAIIVTAKQLLIYALAGDKLADAPMKSIELQEGDSVVMAEWALGDYMDNWEKSFVKNNETKVVQAR